MHPRRSCADEAADARGTPGAPSEHMDRWVVGRDEAEATAAAEQRFPGRPFKLLQVPLPLCLLPNASCRTSSFCLLSHAQHASQSLVARRSNRPLRRLPGCHSTPQP